jgi:hypothetical protein
MCNKLFVLILVTSCLAESIRSEPIDRPEIAISEELCQRLETGKSKIFFRIFCSKQVLPPPPSTTLKRSFKYSSEICEKLCEENNGGAVCNCSDGMPPAVRPPPPPPSENSEPKIEEIRKPKNILKTNFPLPPQ